jgi:hypothetical protein
VIRTSHPRRAGVREQMRDAGRLRMTRKFDMIVVGPVDVNRALFWDLFDPDRCSVLCPHPPGYMHILGHFRVVFPLFASGDERSCLPSGTLSTLRESNPRGSFQINLSLPLSRGRRRFLASGEEYLCREAVGTEPRRHSWPHNVMRGIEAGRR